MDNKIIQTIDRFISEHKQKDKYSKLYAIIQLVLNCSLIEAKEKAKGHCNLLSFYILTFVLKWHEMSYESFFRYLLEHGCVSPKGWITAEKEDILKKLGHDVKLIPYTSLDNLPDGLYQIKINNEYGDHYMAAYTIDNELYLADSSWRGVHVEAKDAIKNDKLIWIKQYTQA